MSVLGRGIKIFLASLSLLLGILAVSYLQKRFDDADMKKALQAVRIKSPSSASCHAEMISRWNGQVRVRCNGEGGWFVDVTRGLMEKETP